MKDKNMSLIEFMKIYGKENEKGSTIHGRTKNMVWDWAHNKTRWNTWQNDPAPLTVGDLLEYSRDEILEKSRRTGRRSIDYLGDLIEEVFGIKW